MHAGVNKYKTEEQNTSLSCDDVLFIYNNYIINMINSVIN